MTSKKNIEYLLNVEKDAFAELKKKLDKSEAILNEANEEIVEKKR